MMGTDFNTTETKSTQPSAATLPPEAREVLRELKAVVREDITREQIQREQAARKASG